MSNYRFESLDEAHSFIDSRIRNWNRQSACIRKYDKDVKTQTKRIAELEEALGYLKKSAESGYLNDVIVIDVADQALKKGDSGE